MTALTYLLVGGIGKTNMKFKNSLGTWRLTFEDDKQSLITIKNQAQAKFINDNMYHLRIKEWRAID